MKLLNWIWAKPKKQEVQQTWTIERNGWEQSAIQYDRFASYMQQKTADELGRWKGN